MAARTQWGSVGRIGCAAGDGPSSGSAGSGDMDRRVRLCVRRIAVRPRSQAQGCELAAASGPPRSRGRVSDRSYPAATDQPPHALGQNGEAILPKLVEGEVRVIGPRWSPRVHEIKTFLARSRVPYRWLGVEQNDLGAG